MKRGSPSCATGCVSTLGIEFVWEVRLILAKEQAHGLQLGGAQRLGLSSWLADDRRQRDLDDLIFSPEPLENPF